MGGKWPYNYGLLYMDTPVLADQNKTYVHQLSVDTACCLQDLLGVMTNWNGYWERVEGSVLSVCLDDAWNLFTCTSLQGRM